MQKRIRKFNVDRWANRFLEDLKSTSSKKQREQPSIFLPNKFASIARKYNNSKRRLILLDYDGTLIGFRNEPEKAVPDSELLELIERLTASEKNEVYIVSGRDHKTLGTWFGASRANLIAEHGFYKKRCFQDWAIASGATTKWKERIKPLLEQFVSHTPGSFIEEKTYSLAWHYRKTSADLGNSNTAELLKILKAWNANLNIQILNGNKVIEITTANINKGSAVQPLLRSGVYDFILAIGDDHTDELLFGQLPENAISVKVGTAPTCAQYRLDDFRETREFLSKLISKKEVVVKTEKLRINQLSGGL